MGLFDLFRKKTKDEKDLEEISNRAKSTQAQMTQAMPTVTISLEDTIPEVKKPLAEGRKIYAVKYVKENAGVGLAEAKAFVEKFE